MNTSCAVDPCVCPLCGQANRCAMEDRQAPGSTPCWCTRVTFSAQLLQSVPESARGKACICQACAQKAAPSA